MALPSPVGAGPARSSALTVGMQQVMSWSATTPPQPKFAAILT
jgi:hypothetical protein